MKRLERSRSDKMVAGVCGGLAKYLGMDVTVVRVIMAVAIVFAGGGALLYAVLWAAMPEEGSQTSGLDTFVGQVKDWNAQRNVDKGQTAASTPSPQHQGEVFDPYQEPRQQS